MKMVIELDKETINKLEIAAENLGIHGNMLASMIISTDILFYNETGDFKAKVVKENLKKKREKT